MTAVYRGIIADPRYKPVRDDLAAVLGEQLTLLVDEAAKCSHCCPRAERIKLLVDVVDQPVQAAWYAHKVEQIESQSQEESE